MICDTAYGSLPNAPIPKRNVKQNEKWDVHVGHVDSN